MDPEDNSQLLKAAETAALEAGRALRAHAQSWTEIAEEQGRDIKVKADREAEALILAGLAGDVPIFSEESGWHGPPDRDRYWIVDPLDGSANYSRGVPLCAVSIALIEGGQPVLGVVYHFNGDELYSGQVGQGASLNGRPMAVSTIREQSKGVLMTGLPIRADFSPEALGRMAEDMSAWRKVRMIGSAALALAFVAAGRADLYREENSMLWDVAAGVALVRAAGGHVQMSSGPPERPKTVIAHNGVLADLSDRYYLNES